MVTTVWTHNVKEALTGIDGVEQLVNMVLNGEKEGIRQQAQHAFILTTRQKKKKIKRHDQIIENYITEQIKISQL